MYNFDKLTNRRGTNCFKWDEINEGELPMWIADMDFEVAPAIKEGFKNRIENGIYGYTFLGDSFYESYINWWKRRHHFEIKKEWIVFTTGVVPSISSAIRRISEISNNVVVLTPVYNIFFNSIRNNGRDILTCDLIYENGTYRIDFDDLERKLSDTETTVLIFCNPHNPVGRIWTKEEIIKVGELCKKHGVTVISDEIHCDLVDPNKEYVPFASVNEVNREISITLVAPTKTFNLAGIQTSVAIIPNKFLRDRVERGFNTDEIAEPNILAAIAPELAFNESEDWLEELRKYIYENKMIVKSFVEKELPEIHLICGEATYLLWLDCSKVSKNPANLQHFIRKSTGLVLSDGITYGEAGKNFLRMNVATQRERVVDGLNRLKKAIKEVERINEK